MGLKTRSETETTEKWSLCNFILVFCGISQLVHEVSQIIAKKAISKQLIILFWNSVFNEIRKAIDTIRVCKFFEKDR